MTTIASHRWVACLLATVALAPVAGGHGLVNLSVVFPDECPQDGACIETVDHQPRLHAGETVELYVYNDDDELHEVFVTTEERADPERRNTSTEGFLAQAGPVTANRSVSGGNLTVPRDADALYVWCWIDDHEAEGERLVLEVDPAHDETGREAAHEVVVGVSAVLAAALLARVRGRT